MFLRQGLLLAPSFCKHWRICEDINDEKYIGSCEAGRQSTCRQTDEGRKSQTHPLTNKQTTDRQTDIHIEKQTCRQTDIQINRQRYCCAFFYNTTRSFESLSYVTRLFLSAISSGWGVVAKWSKGFSWAWIFFSWRVQLHIFNAIIAAPPSFQLYLPDNLVMQRS